MTTTGQYRNNEVETVGTVKTVLSRNHNYGYMGLRDVAVVVYSAGAATFTHGIVEYSPDGGSNWGTLDGTTFANLGSNSILYGNYNIPNFHLRFVGAVASGSSATSTVSFIYP